jgi:hypothetical protein
MVVPDQWARFNNIFNNLSRIFLTNHTSVGLGTQENDSARRLGQNKKRAEGNAAPQLSISSESRYAICATH